MSSAMSKSLGRLGGLAALVCSFVPASAEVRDFQYTKGGLSGQKSLVGSSSEVDIDCHVVRATTPLVLDPPLHGKLIFSRSRDYPRFNRDNPHDKCINRKIPVVHVFYRSQPGYTGADRFRIEELSSTGDMNLSTFDMIVQ